MDDNLDERNNAFPLSCSLVAGTQAEKAKDNQLITIHLSNLNPLSQDESDDEDDYDKELPNEQKIENKPEFRAAIIPHHGTINRIKVFNITLNQTKIINPMVKIL